MVGIDPNLEGLVRPLLERHEGKERRLYLDNASPPQWTIGIGRNLSAKGLREDEVYYLFGNDLLEALADARACVGPCFNGLSVARQAALLDMAFNLGRLRLSGFVNMLQAVKEGRYSDAAKQMRNSLWAKQVGGRAEELAAMMERG